MALLLLPLAGGPKDGKHFGGLFLLLVSIQAQLIVRGVRRNETATIETVRKKPLRYGSCGIKPHEAECFATTRQLTFK